MSSADRTGGSTPTVQEVVFGTVVDESWELPEEDRRVLEQLAQRNALNRKLSWVEAGNIAV